MFGDEGSMEGWSGNIPRAGCWSKCPQVNKAAGVRGQSKAKSLEEWVQQL